MSTKLSIRLEHDEKSRTGFHLYGEIFDEEHVYLDLEGAPFEAAYMPVFKKVPAIPRVPLRFSSVWAERLGLIKSLDGGV